MARKAAAAVWERVDRLVPWKDNPRHNEAAVPKVARSILQYGWGAPVVARKADRMLIAGHTRIKAYSWLCAHVLEYVEQDGQTFSRWRARTEDDGPYVVPGGSAGEVPVRYLDVTADEARALALADNRLGEIASWDDAKLSAALRKLADTEIPLPTLGWDDRALERFLATEEVSAHTRGKPGDDAPDPDAATVHSRRGEVYQLGPHRVMCGDSTDPEDVARLLDGETAEVLHADPPYGMGKEADGVANDNLYGPKLDAFMLAWWLAWWPHVVDNGSAYVWGNAADLWRWWYTAAEPATDPAPAPRCEVVWYKGDQAQGVGSGIRTFAPTTERCLFLQGGRLATVNNTKAEFFEGFRPLLDYLRGEADRMGWTAADVKRITGVGMWGHWFTDVQWDLLPEPRYAQLREASEGQAFGRPYGSLREEYARARSAQERERAYFDDRHDLLRDVWKFGRVEGEDRHGHATPKPVAMMERVARTSAREGALVLEPFGGSGSTMMGCEAAGRRCFTMELEPVWVDVIRRRWTAHARAEGIDPGAGALD